MVEGVLICTWQLGICLNTTTSLHLQSTEPTGYLTSIYLTLVWTDPGYLYSHQAHHVASLAIPPYAALLAFPLGVCRYWYLTAHEASALYSGLKFASVSTHVLVWRRVSHPFSKREMQQVLCRKMSALVSFHFPGWVGKSNFQNIILSTIMAIMQKSLLSKSR